VPVAEPSGEYQVRCSVDLSPAYGKIEGKKTVTITRPPEDILERRLEELASEDASVRRIAAMDLSFFPKNGKRVFPALLACLDEADESVRMNAIIAMNSFGDQIKRHSAILIKMLRNEKEQVYCRSRIAYYLGRHAPVSEEVEQALKAAAASVKGSNYEQSFTYALERYKHRVQEEADRNASPGIGHNW
jgi:HEAT repeat protein